MKKTLLTAFVAAMTVMAPAARAESVAHGYQMGDEKGLYGFISFPISGHLSPTMDKRNYGETHVSAGECVDGVYYTFEVYPDVMGGISAYSYTVRNASTFEVISQKLQYDTSRRVVDMTYDYTTNTMYALVENKESTGEITSTSLNVVDMATGDCYVVGSPGNLTAVNGYGKDVEEVLLTLAADAQGNLYAMGDYRQFYKLDKLTGAATKVSAVQHGIATAPQFQSMAFDGEGVLYWAQTHPDYGYLLTIDPVTGVPSYMAEDPNPDTKWKNEASLLGDGAEVTGLWFEKPFTGNAPAAPTALKIENVVGTGNSFNLSWALPAKDIDGNAVSLTGVTVYCLGLNAPVATLPAGATSCTVTDLPDGFVTLMVCANSAAGQGRGAMATVYSGADYLMPVTDLTATLTGNTVTLNWNAPTSTYNGGYADYDHITYRVWRIKGDSETILTSVHAVTNYTDELTAPGTYYYAVEAISCGVVGYACNSNEVTVEATAAATIPYFSGFEDDGDGTQWTSQSINYGNTSYGWTVVKGTASQTLEGKFAQHKTSGSAYTPDDYLFSPAIEMNAGDYVLDYMMNGAGSFDAHTYSVYLADGPSADANVIAEIEVVDNQKFTSSWEAHAGLGFTVPESGVYHLVYHVTTPTTYATLRIDNVSITAAPKTAAKLPYACDFEEGSDKDEWTIVNTNPHVVRTAGWVYNTDATSPHGSNVVQLYVFGVSEGEYDDWMISPAIEFPEAGTYVVTYAAAGKSYDTHKWAVRLGTDPADASSFSQTVVQHDKTKFTTWADYSHEFTVSTPGTYHIGLHGQGCDTGTRLTLDNIRVAKVVSTGVEGVAAEGMAVPVAYYNLHGQQLAAPVKGVNIIRYSDGSVRKEVR